MRLVVEYVEGADSGEPFAWPVDKLGNAQVPRVGDDVVLPESNWTVAGVYWNPLGDPVGWPERGIASGQPFVYVTLRPWGLP